MSDEKLMDEPGRILALKRYGVLDSGREQNFDAITSLVCSVLDVPICAVSLVDEERQWFKSIAGLDVSETPREQAFCDHTIRARGVMQVDDATADARFAGNELVTSDPLIRSYVGAPLVTPDGYQLGALCAIDRKPRSFDASQRALLERFSGLVVEQLELRTLAHQDFLTNALTRRAFCERARAALGQHARDRSPAALLTFDVDHFKAVNDRFGHGTGDQVLKGIADACRAALRPGDLFGRLGGEEFAVLLPDTEAGPARACAERLRAAIQLNPALGCPVVSASFGMAMATDESVDQWLVAADEALYEAKRGGRNRCVVAERERRAA
ncbi:sensor domain-containing diguanylate cyclase [Sphingomonas sp. RB1R13]|uniref:sensor domain-containing diguanylate cyclase n=1 Tax=Sphingomonas sp. RB1R13 TaxID=3096159 RepID=UPI002FC6FC39